MEPQLQETPSSPPPPTAEELLEKLGKQNDEILRIAQKLERHMFWSQVWGLFKLIIIVGPIIWGILYLPQLLDQVVAPYRELLGDAQGAQQAIPSNLDLNALLKMVKPQ